VWAIPGAVGVGGAGADGVIEPRNTLDTRNYLAVERGGGGEGWNRQVARRC
jgi:hypothetical protein